MPTVNINNHNMYYEIHGKGEPVLCMGGWGSYCHGNHYHLAKGLIDKYKVIIFDHRGLGKSNDNEKIVPSMKLYANDAIKLIDFLNLPKVHLIGLVGMGACIAQEIAIIKPKIVKSMINMNTWAKVDDLLRHQLEMLRDVHREMGWKSFQKLVCLWSFEENFYLENQNRILGVEGPWRELNGKYKAHERLIEACINHNTLDRLHNIKCPTLIIHCPKDTVNGPRLTNVLEKGISGARGHTIEGAAHVIAGKEMRKKFSALVLEFLDEVNDSKE